MLSMTGYGRGECAIDGLNVAVEIKTVNNRFLDVFIKAPKLLSCLEENSRSVIKSMLSRGHADVFVTFSDKRKKSAKLSLDEMVAQNYVDIAEKAKTLFPNLANDFTLSQLLRCPDVIVQDDAISIDDDIKNSLNNALVLALNNLNAMRKVEGAKLEIELNKRIENVANLVEKIAKRAPCVSKNYEIKLREKMVQDLGDTTYDESKLLSEVAIFADRCNIDEEITRLFSHIEQFKNICKGENIGRRLDFLVQEFNRESNTICSKSNDLEVTRLALELKNEIEKIREQIQNVE